MDTGESSCCSKKRQFRLISHRCKGFNQRSNSAAAFRAALSSPVDEIELDFRSTNDGGIVAAHLPWYRLPSGSFRLICSENYRVAAQNGLMTLSEALDIYIDAATEKRLRFELKGSGFERELIKEVSDRNLLDRVSLVTWRGSTAESIRALQPDIRIGFSFLLGAQGAGWFPICEPMRIPSIIAKKPNLISSVNIVPSYASPSIPFINALQDLNLEVCLVTTYGTWTKEWVEKLGVDGIITSNPNQFI